MPVLLKIALRNLREHRAKTLIVGTIIALGIAVLVVGNSVMDSAAIGIRRAFIENHTGDAMITAKTEGFLSLFGYSVSTGNEKTPAIPRYPAVHQYVSQRPEVAATTSQVGGMALVGVGETTVSAALLFGVEPKSYFAMFPHCIRILEGTGLVPGEPGILVSREKIEEIRKTSGAALAVGDRLTLTGYGVAGFRIREVPLVGIFQFPYTNEFMRLISFTDVQTLRALNHMVLATPSDIRVSREETRLLESGDPDALFQDDMVGISSAAGTPLSEERLDSIFQDGEGRRAAVELDSGSWHYLLVRLKDPRTAPVFIADLNRYFAENRIEAHASDWLTASGPAGSLAYGMKSVFNVLVLIVAVVAVVIIMNTLLVSVIERTAEIGTMRALGAQKRFVRRMFLLETMSTSILFGAVGILLSGVVLGFLGLVGIRASNPFFELLFAGMEFRPSLSLPSVLAALGVIVGIGLVSSLYPVLVALRIQPVKAMQAE